MAEKLDFSIPPRKERAGRFGKMAVAGLLFILTLLILVDVWFAACDQPLGTGSRGHTLTAEQTKALATKLNQRQLYARAAAVWQDYLARADLDETEGAQALFQVGLALEKSGDYAQAIEYFYRSETTAPLDHLAAEINAHVKQCFEQLGKFSALRYELMERTRYQASDTPGADVVAEIGPQKITKADLMARVEEQIDNQLAPMTAFMSPEDLNQQKQRMLQQFQTPQAQQQFLQQWLGQEILYREALEQDLSGKTEVKKMLAEITRNVLAQQFLDHQLAAKIHITPGDLQTYYQARQAEFKAPAQATIRHIRLEDEAAATKLLTKLQEGADFASMAVEYSQAPDAKETQGALASPVIQGQAIPGIGANPELETAIFAAAPPALLPEPFETDQGWEIIQVDQITAERQKPFDEVRQEVMMTLTNQKRQEVQQDLIERMMEKYNVIVHPSTLAPPPETAPEMPQ
jgi:parvulin-like peptidyl-prolyl isomerase